MFKRKSRLHFSKFIKLYVERKREVEETSFMSAVRQAKYSKYSTKTLLFVVVAVVVVDVVVVLFFSLLLGRVIKSSYINNKFFNKSLLVVVFLF